MFILNLLKKVVFKKLKFFQKTLDFDLEILLFLFKKVFFDKITTINHQAKLFVFRLALKINMD